MKKYLALVLALCLVIGLIGCEKKAETKPKPQVVPQPEGPLVGISMPDDSWKEHAASLEEELHKLGYRTETCYAENQADKQIRQIETLLEEQVACLVVTAVDAFDLWDVLAQAQEQNVPVVAYDRHLTDTDAVDVLVSFDYRAMGMALGEKVVAEKALEKALEENISYTVEFFMGTPEDNTAYLFHLGLMEVLQPYLDAGVLTCPSGRTAFVDVMVSQGSSAEAKCGDLLRSIYPNKTPSVICAGSAQLAKGCKEAVKEHLQEGMEEPLVLCGQAQDYAALAQLGSTAVHDLVSGVTIETQQTVDNYMIDVPALFCK